MRPLNSILTKLIRNRAGKAKMVMAMVALSAALLLLLISVQLQVNYHQLLNQSNGKDSIADFLVINKQLNDGSMSNTTIADAQVKQLAQQPFVDAVGVLTPSRFKASIESKSSSFPFYTDISFESVGADFIDIPGVEWTWQEQSDYIPIIVPNQFLDFYNFQFSFSQNLPQLSTNILKMLVFKVNIYGPKGAISLNGKIVGFSDRIAALLVPEEFMQWGNKVFANQEMTGISRVIIKTKDPSNPALSTFLKRNQLTTETQKMRFSKYRKLVDTIVAIAGITGIVLLAFALLIFMLMLEVSIAQAKPEIVLLVSLGASPKQLSRFLMRQFLPPHLIAIGASLLVVGILQKILQQVLINQQMKVSAWLSPHTFAIALGLVGVVWWVNKKGIQRQLY